MRLTGYSTSPAFGRAGDLPNRIAAAGSRLIRHTETGATGMAEADFLVVGRQAATAGTLAIAPRLRGVPEHGLGLNAIDIPACAARGLPLTAARGANLARGDVPDLDALATAPTEGRLEGAAIDPYPAEPPDRSHPAFADPRVIFTPHSGTNTTESPIRIGQMVMDDI
ncbi:MAG: NAD(P)-dependent oxidoreductase, partial [Gemmobacter sp.]